MARRNNKCYYVYIIASCKNGTLYIGVTNNLIRRVQEHKKGKVKGFSKKYKVKNLVWYESTNDISEAISLEKRMKKWNRAWKIRAIEELNPSWKDLYYDLII